MRHRSLVLVMALWLSGCPADPLPPASVCGPWCALQDMGALDMPRDLEVPDLEAPDATPDLGSGACEVRIGSKAYVPAAFDFRASQGGVDVPVSGTSEGFRVEAGAGGVRLFLSTGVWSAGWDAPGCAEISSQVWWAPVGVDLGEVDPQEPPPRVRTHPEGRVEGVATSRGWHLLERRGEAMVVARVDGVDPQAQLVWSQDGRAALFLTPGRAWVWARRSTTWAQTLEVEAGESARPWGASGFLVFGPGDRVRRVDLDVGSTWVEESWGEVRDVVGGPEEAWLLGVDGVVRRRTGAGDEALGSVGEDARRLIQGAGALAVLKGPGACDWREEGCALEIWGVDPWELREGPLEGVLDVRAASASGWTILEGDASELRWYRLGEGGVRARAASGSMRLGAFARGWVIQEESQTRVLGEDGEEVVSVPGAWAAWERGDETLELAQQEGCAETTCGRRVLAPSGIVHDEAGVWLGRERDAWVGVLETETPDRAVGVVVTRDGMPRAVAQSPHVRLGEVRTGAPCQALVMTVRSGEGGVSRQDRAVCVW